MVTKVNIKDIKVQWLNARCLNSMAKYAKLAYDIDETIIMVSSDSCLKDIVDHASASTNEQTKWVYNELKAALRDLLTLSHIQPKLDALQTYEYVEESTNPRANHSQYRN